MSSKSNIYKSCDIDVNAEVYLGSKIPENNPSGETAEDEIVKTFHTSKVHTIFNLNYIICF